MNFTLTEQETELVGKALGLLPYKEVCILVAKLQGQINEQVKEERKDEVQPA